VLGANEPTTGAEHCDDPVVEIVLIFCACHPPDRACDIAWLHRLELDGGEYLEQMLKIAEVRRVDGIAPNGGRMAPIPT
jgi:hypothetical protein